MHPSIQDGELVTVAPLCEDGFTRGDVLLCQYGRGPTAHRVVSMRAVVGERTQLRLRGDNLLSSDCPISADRVIGRIVSVRRGGSDHPVERHGVGRVTAGLKRRLRIAALAAFCSLVGVPASAQVLSGSYTGDGTDSRQVTPGGDELGFQPDVVILKGNTTQTAVIRTSTMTGDSAKPLVGATGLMANRIESFDASGFTVGSDASTNGNTVNYYWVAFKQAAKRMKVGSYVGNGGASQSITGVGFSPELVFIMSAGAAEAVYRSSADTESFNFEISSGSTTWITGLGADGFTVGSDARVNANGTTYHYVAWNEVGGVMDVGTYTGNGSDNRNITTPEFAPEYVLVKQDGAQELVHHPASLGATTDETLFFEATANANNRIQSLTADGFEVGTALDVNESGMGYHYIAWRREVKQSEVLSGSYTGNGVDNRAITGLGFTPDIVLVKGNNTQAAVLRTAVGVGSQDLSKDVLDGTLSGNRIQSIDAEGFTIGTDARVNANGVTYHWIAWKGGVGEMTVGIYVGNGTSGRSITDLGFSPEFVIVAGDNTSQAVYRNGAGSLSYAFSGSSSSGWITALGADGFTVDSDTRVNGSGATYAFMAWNEVAGKMDVGSYTGNATDNRNIAGVGFQPEFVMTQSDGGKAPVAHSNAMGASTDTSHFFNQTAHTNNLIQALQSNGFQVGTGDEANESGKAFVYAAWARPALTAVRIASMKARQTEKGVLLHWRTGYEVDNLGFHVYRESRGERTRLTRSPLAGSGLIVAPGVEVTAGHSYSWRDDSAAALGEGVRYWIQDVDLHGKRTWHGPIIATPSKPEKKDKEKEKNERQDAKDAAGKDKSDEEQRPREDSEHDRRETEDSSGADTSSTSLEELTAPLEPVTPQPLQPEPVAPPAAPVGLVDWPFYVAAPFVSEPAIEVRQETAAPGAAPVSAPIVSPAPPAAPAPATIPANKRAVASRTETAARLSQPPARSPLPPAPPRPRRRSTTVGARREEPSPAMQRQWAVASGASVKLGIRATGWYRVSQPALVAAGLPAEADPHTLRLLVDGVEQPMRINGDSDGRFDPSDSIEFFATRADTPYTDTRTYWVATGTERGSRLPFADGRQAGTSGPASFPHTAERKDRTIFFAALMNGDKENFFGPLIMEGESTDQTVNLPGLAAGASGDAQLEVALQGVTELDAVDDHRVGVRVNGIEVGEVVLDGLGHAISQLPVPYGHLVDGENTVSLEARGGEDDISLLDYLRIRYQRVYRAAGNELAFSADGGHEITVSGFTTPAIQVIDVTGDVASHGVVGTIAADGLGWQVTFTVPGSGRRSLLALTSEVARQPASVRANLPSTLHRQGQLGDIVMVTHQAFAGALEPLKAHREGQGYSVRIVDIEDVYDEFSFGQKTPLAIRDFMIRASQYWREPPRFALLVGNATTDPRDYYGFGDADFVPTRVVQTGVMEAASDEWFVDADEDGFADLATIGRLPARTAGQAADMVSKIVAYEQGAAEAWRQSVVFVADSDDTGLVDYAALNDRARRLVPASYQVTNILRASDPSAGATLRDRWNAGAFLVNYHGHGSVASWQLDLLTADDVPLLTNGAKLPIVVAMNCFNGFFSSLFPEESLAEALVRAPNGGAVGVWASSGMTSSSWQALMDRELFRQIFQGRWRSIGDAMRAAKQVVGDPDVRRTWIYFGDPAMRLIGVPEPPPATVVDSTSTNSPTTPGGDSGDNGQPDDQDEELDGDEGDHNARPGVRLVDFDRDGRDDAFLIDPYTGLWFSALGGPGDFLYSAGQWTVVGEPMALDLNGDRRADLFVYDPATGRWIEALSRGDGRFVTRSDTWSVGYTIRTGDFDGNGREDVFGLNGSNGRWFQALSSGDGDFVYRTGQGLHDGEVRVAEFNGDGRADVLVYDPASGRWTLMISGAATTMTGNWGAGWQVLTAYLDADARADLVLWHPASGAWVQGLRANNQPFVYRTGFWTPGGHVHPLDADGDGRDELLRYDARTGTWTMTRMGPTLELTQTTGLWEAGWTLASGDLDGDGRDDLLLYNADTGQWMRRLSHTSTWPDQVSGAWAPGWVLAGRRP